MLKLGINGYWRDTYKYSDGGVKKFAWKKNTICIKGLEAITGIITGYAGIDIANSIFLALGEGSTPLPTSADTLLVAELTPASEARKLPTTLQYLTDSDVTSATPTRTVYMIFDILITDLIGENITEFGIFLGDDSGNTDTGYMLNHVIHTGIAKGSFAIQREIKIVFS